MGFDSEQAGTLPFACRIPAGADRQCARQLHSRRAEHGCVSVNQAWRNNRMVRRVELRYLGPRPLTEDGAFVLSGDGTLDGRSGYRWANGWRVQLDAFNLPIVTPIRSAMPMARSSKRMTFSQCAFQKAAAYRASRSLPKRCHGPRTAPGRTFGIAVDTCRRHFERHNNSASRCTLNAKWSCNQISS